MQINTILCRFLSSWVALLGNGPHQGVIYRNALGFSKETKVRTTPC